MHAHAAIGGVAKRRRAAQACYAELLAVCVSDTAGREIDIAAVRMDRFGNNRRSALLRRVPRPSSSMAEAFPRRRQPHASNGCGPWYLAPLGLVPRGAAWERREGRAEGHAFYLHDRQGTETLPLRPAQHGAECLRDVVLVAHAVSHSPGPGSRADRPGGATPRCAQPKQRHGRGGEGNEAESRGRGRRKKGRGCRSSRPRGPPVRGRLPHAPGGL